MPPTSASAREYVLWRRWLTAAALLLGGAVLAVAFLGYRQPELLLEFVNLRYCG